MKPLHNIFPELLLALCSSKAKILHEPGFNAWVIQAENGWQIAIMHFEKDSVRGEFHVNDCSQWGIVLDGEMLLWSPRRRVLKKGDTFFVRRGKPHCVAIKAGYKDLTIFDGRRYVLKPGHEP